MPSGAVETEDVLPMEAAKRELLEETGYTSNHFI
ncbi:NUDIX domain-containing protein [Nostoc sp. JL23]|nr:NUDIX domain-containing protein [Nostoc sp. JL23]